MPGGNGRAMKKRPFLGKALEGILSRNSLGPILYAPIFFSAFGLSAGH